MTCPADIEEFFASDFQAARQRFLAACADTGLEVQSFINDSIDGEARELATDTVRIGNASAKKLLVLTSGMHGVELFCGSGCQVGLLRQGLPATLPRDTAVLMIHAINPWGASHWRRNNEDNVDLCRNFIDFAEALPENPAYEQVHDALACSEYAGEQRQAANRRLEAFQKTHGRPAWISAVMAGQYHYPDGMSFGGHQPSWSNRTLVEILSPYRETVKKVCLVDYHSGLGPYAYGSIVCLQEGEDLERAKRCFGPWLSAPLAQTGQSAEKFHPATGHSTEGHRRCFPNAELSSVVVEFGTYDPAANLQALLDDHWLNQHGDETSEPGRLIKQVMLHTHYPDDPEWRVAVWTRSQQVLRQALKGLGND